MAHLRARFVFVIFLVVAMAALPPRTSAAEPATRPNIVFILADDLAWNDLGCCGHPWHDTPHLDRLAREGMRFTRGYASAPICSASRASLLTGKSPARLGFEFVTKDSPTPPAKHPLTPPDYTLELPLDEVTLAEALAAGGYTSCYLGKWHVSRHTGHYLGWSPTHGPRQQGFAEGDPDFGGHAYAETKGGDAAGQRLDVGDYGEDTLADRAAAYIRAPHDAPFFLYLAEYYVHLPFHRRAAWLEDKYRKRLPPDAAQDRAVYAAMVETLDHLVGRVLVAIDEAGLAERTLVVFTSDNGGHPEYAANGPLRGGKWNLYEGGIRAPWIARWPKHIAAGVTSDVPMVGYDLMPTLCAAAGVPPPAGVALDGVDLSPVMFGRATSVAERALVWHFPYYHPETKYEQAPPAIGVDDFAISKTEPQSAIRQGDFKLVHFYESDRDELYDLSLDASEQHDLSREQPARAAELRRALEDYLDKVQARRPTRRDSAAGQG